jgi:hypothetical protein
VAFSGSYQEGKPNGGGQIRYGSGLAYGVGFTVFGSVSSGGIGHIMKDTNLKNPGGAWTIEQWTSGYTNINGSVYLKGGPAHADLNSTVPYEINGNEFRWYDHPGLEDKDPQSSRNPLKSYEGRFDIAVKVINGAQQCEVKFRISSTFSNGNWSHSWGQLN